MAGRFGEANAPGDHSFQDFIAEELAEVGGNLTGEVGTVVIHRKENSLDRDGMPEGFANTVDGVHECGDAFKGEEFALDGNEDGVGGHEGVEGKKIEGGWAVDEYVLVVFADIFEVGFEDGLAVLGVSELEVDADEVLVGGNDVEAVHFGAVDGVADFSGVGQDVVGGREAIGLSDSEAACGVSLGIGIDQEDLDFTRGQCCREIDGGRSFTDATFLIGYSDDFAQRGFALLQTVTLT